MTTITRSKDSQTQPTENKLELKLNIKDLECLQEAFSMAGNGYNNMISLDRERFVEALSLVLCKGNKDEYNDLFDKIDITRDGHVDWEKFASHMLLEFYEKDDRTKSSALPQWKELKTLIGPHKDVIQKIIHMKNFNRYLTISKEGNIGMWGSDLKLQASIKTSTSSCRPRDLWITDFIYLHNVNKIAVSFTSKEIDFYDMGVKLDLVCKIRLHNIPRIPLTMDYWAHPDNTGHALMVWGDTDGFINVLSWSALTSSIFERSSAKASDKDENMLVISMNEIINNSFRAVTFFSHQAHQDWIRKVSYVPNLECFVSCATNWNSSLVISWLEKHNPSSSTSSEINGSKEDLLGNEYQDSRGISKTFVFTVHQGINSFAYNENMNLIATAGVNFHVCLWNPYVVSKPNGLLRGHMASVTDVQFNKARALLFSFSKDKVLRIWDVQLQVCLHRLAGVFPRGQEVALMNSRIILYSKMFFHEEKMRLFITFNFGLTMLEMKPDIKDKIFSHQKPLIGCLYNSLYNQIVTACTEGIIYCWMVDTGQRVKTIADVCSPGAEMTCITQDLSQTRLYTGATDGLVKIYDFNGYCYNTLVCANGNAAEIGQIVILKRCVLVFGFSKLITAFWTSNFKDHKVYPSEWNGIQTHKDDILSGASIPPHAVATGAYDGEIIIWNINSEQASRTLTSRSQQAIRDIRSMVDQHNVSKQSNSLLGSSRRNEKTPIIYGPPASTDKAEESSESSTSSDSTSTDTVSDMEETWSDLCPDCVGVAIYLKMDCMFNISRLVYLECRRKNKAGANLVSCGGNGIVRFWNFTDGHLVGEYLAHNNASSIIMSIDSQNNHYLATGDMDGNVKVWDISAYCLTEGANALIMQEPPLLAQWQAHTDEVSGIVFCARFGRTLIVSSSADQSAALWEMNGHLVGRLGQEARWKLSATVESPVTLEVDIEESQVEQKDSDLYHVDPNWQPDPEATKDPANYRINIWQSTTLGTDYQELRVKKRERVQPHTIPDLPFLYGEKLGRPSFGPFFSLEISKFDDIQELEVPEFMDYPDKFFTDTEDYLVKTARVPLFTDKQQNKSNVNNACNKLDALRAVFDEKSLFVRDFEVKSRHKFAVPDKPRMVSESGFSESGSAHKPGGNVRLQPIHETNKAPTHRNPSLDQKLSG